MAQRVVLHLGAMKSGTSFIQNVLGENKQALRGAGVLFPGTRWRDQVDAVQEFNDRGPRNTSPLDPHGPWMRLADEINAWQGTAVVSMEFLGPRSPAQIRLIRESLTAARVEAVLTVRDLTRSVPAMWLESVQNGSQATWTDFLQAVSTRDGSRTSRSFWRHQDVPRIARRWMQELGPDNFTLVTVPPPGSPADLLWRRFASILDVDPDAFSLDVRANPAIGLASAMVLRRLNEQLEEQGLEDDDYKRLVKHNLAKRGLVQRQPHEPRLGFDEAWAHEQARAQIDRLRALGCRVVGDLDELQPRVVAGVQPEAVTSDDLLAATADGLAFMVMLQTDLTGREGPA